MAQVVVVLAIVLLVPLGIEYVRQAGLKHQWRQAEAQIDSQLATARAENAALEAEKGRVQTDAYLEQAARERLKLARPGDVVVVIAATPRPVAATATPEPGPTLTPTPSSWLASLFGR